MQQEVAKVKVAVGSAHFAEVDDAGVPAMVVEPDVGGIEIAVGQVPSGDRPLPLLVGGAASRSSSETVQIRVLCAPWPSGGRSCVRSEVLPVRLCAR